MITEFDLLDSNGRVVAQGEIDTSGVHRVFSKGQDYEEFQSGTALLETYTGHAIQPHLFETYARTRQLKML